MEVDGTVGRLLSWKNYGGRWDCRDPVVLEELQCMEAEGTVGRLLS